MRYEAPQLVSVGGVDAMVALVEQGNAADMSFSKCNPDLSFSVCRG